MPFFKLENKIIGYNFNFDHLVLFLGKPEANEIGSQKHYKG